MLIKDNSFSSQFSQSASNVQPIDSELNGKELWDAEYSKQETTIPSSLRANPSHAVQVALEAMNFNFSDSLDLGCGNGRNARFMAEHGISVSALDFSKVAIDLTKKSLECENTNAGVTPFLHDIKTGLPFENARFDLVLDSYCLCHFIEDDEYEAALDEVSRVLKPGGVYLKIHLDDSDAYYKERTVVVKGYGHVSHDPENSFYKRHYCATSFENELMPRFRKEKTWHVGFADMVGGSKYARNVFAMALTKK